MSDDSLLAGAVARLHQGHCREVQAVNAAGERVEASDPSAVAWCATGALRAEANGDWQRYFRLLNVLDEQAVEIYGDGIVTVNDDIGLTAVLQVYEHTRDWMEAA